MDSHNIIKKIELACTTLQSHTSITAGERGRHMAQPLCACMMPYLCICISSITTYMLCTGYIHFLCSKPLDDATSTTSAAATTTPTHPHPSTKHPSQPPTAQEPVSLDQLVKRLQEHVLCNRIRVSEHFQDFDPLRSGSISATRFRQVHSRHVISRPERRRN